MRVAVFGMLLMACGGAATTPTAETPLPQTTDEAKTYAIHLHHDCHVAERTHVVIDARDSKKLTTTNADGVVVDTSHTKTSVHFDAIATVVAVGPKHEETRTVYDVAELTSHGKPLFHGKVELTRALKQADATLLVNDAQPSSDVYEALKAVLTLRTGGPTDDEVFGTTEPQRVGAHWPINGKRAREDLEAEGLAGGSISGNTMLVGVTRAGTLDCLDVRSELRLTDPDLNTSGAVMESGSLTAEITGLFPIDESHGRLEDHLVMHATMKMRMDSTSMTLTLDLTSYKDGHYTLM